MFLDEIEALLQSLAADTLERIREDRRRVPDKLKPVLAYIEMHLFDQDLSIAQLKRACGIRDNAMATLFNTKLGLPPWTYITECRLETAVKLLRGSDRPISEVAKMVGYSGLPVFSRAFTRYFGQSPTTYREKSEELGPFTLFDDMSRLETWRRAMSGELSQEEARAIIARLRRIYPVPQPGQAAPLPPPERKRGAPPSSGRRPGRPRTRPL